MEHNFLNNHDTAISYDTVADSGASKHHDSIKNLFEILKSQVSHYTTIYETLCEERDAITNWDSNKIIELNSIKENLTKKERLLEEARKTISLRLQAEYGLNDNTLQSIIDAINDDNEYKNKLINLRDSLLLLVADISKTTAMLKVVYNTNLNIINDITSKMGYIPTNKYGMDKSKSTISSLQITG